MAHVREAVHSLLIFYHHNVGDETAIGYTKRLGARRDG
uniref:Uncharacterized protein n=1 Tax=Moniliophthora roreri TaxID=221103 RepID=A0A0W0GEI1_MONRR